MSEALNVSVDVLGIADFIKGEVTHAQNRGAFVKNLANTAFYKAGQKYNVMVFNLNMGYEQSFQNVKLYASATHNGIIFGIWVFESGTFQNKGDGGYINWAFHGWFDRKDGNVSFRRP